MTAQIIGFEKERGFVCHPLSWEPNQGSETARSMEYLKGKPDTAWLVVSEIVGDDAIAAVLMIQEAKEPEPKGNYDPAKIVFLDKFSRNVVLSNLRQMAAGKGSPTRLRLKFEDGDQLTVEVIGHVEENDSFMCNITKWSPTGDFARIYKEAQVKGFTFYLSLTNVTAKTAEATYVIWHPSLLPYYQQQMLRRN